MGVLVCMWVGVGGVRVAAVCALCVGWWQAFCLGVLLTLRQPATPHHHQMAAARRCQRPLCAAALRLLPLLLLLLQTRRLCKFPEGTRQKCEAFQLRPARHAIPRDATRQKIPDLPLPAEVSEGPTQCCASGCGSAWWGRNGVAVLHSAQQWCGGASARCCPFAIGCWLHLVRLPVTCPRPCTTSSLPPAPPPPRPLTLSQIVGPIQVARRSDMDMNGHVNNVTYLAWALETVPRAVFGVAHLYQVEIDFKAECKSGQLVESLAAHTGAGAGPC